MEIPINEVMRYLGYRGAEPDERISGLVKELCAVFASGAEPKSVYGIWDCNVDSFSVTFNGFTVNSENLARHLTGCRRAALLAATLGPGADTLIRRFSVRDMEKAAIAQAVCTVMIDSYCDELEKEIAQKPEFSGLFGTGRFSPGYGDFDIVWQKNIVKMLNCDRSIGLTLTSASMLVPSKSITAVIGYSEEKKHASGSCGASSRCERCADKQCGVLSSCAFRENK